LENTIIVPLSCVREDALCCECISVSWSPGQAIPKEFAPLACVSVLLKSRRFSAHGAGAESPDVGHSGRAGGTLDGPQYLRVMIRT
jgi:hypothetical protein